MLLGRTCGSRLSCRVAKKFRRTKALWACNWSARATVFVNSLVFNHPSLKELAPNQRVQSQAWNVHTNRKQDHASHNLIKLWMLQPQILSCNSHMLRSCPQPAIHLGTRGEEFRLRSRCKNIRWPVDSASQSLSLDSWLGLALTN